jgi:hypothetical protein
VRADFLVILMVENVARWRLKEISMPRGFAAKGYQKCGL